MFHIVWDWPVFLSQLFGFAVIVQVLVKWVVPPVASAMAKAQNTIRVQLVNSERAAEKVAAAAEADEAAVAQAAIAAEHFAREACAEAERIIEQAREAAEAEAARVHRYGQEQIARLRGELTRELRSDLHTAVLASTEQQVRQRLEASKARTDSVDRFLDELEAIG